MAAGACVVAAVGLSAAAVWLHAAAATKNVGFVGHLGMTAQAWTVSSQSANGGCTGTTPLGGPYGFTACQMTGNTDSFTTTYPDYDSYNTRVSRR